MFETVQKYTWLSYRKFLHECTFNVNVSISFLCGFKIHTKKNRYMETYLNYRWFRKLWYVLYLFISWLEVAQKKYTRLPDWGRHLNTKGFPREISGPTSAPSSFTADKARLLPSSCKEHEVMSKGHFLFMCLCGQWTETTWWWWLLPAHPLVSIVVKAAVMCEYKPPLPPAFNQTRVGTLVKITATRWSGGVRTTSNVWPNGQR